VPLAVSLPAEGTLTLIVAVLPLTARRRTVIAALQPVTSIGVAWWISAPFCATNSVGIVSLLVHRSAVAARTEYLPWGNVSSKLSNGTSGVSGNVEDVIPFLMSVSPTVF